MYERGCDVWLLGFHGPRCVAFVEHFPPPNGNMTTEPSQEGKAVVTFHGVPEVVEMKNLFATANEAYADAIRQSLDQIGIHSEQIVTYRKAMHGSN